MEGSLLPHGEENRSGVGWGVGLDQGVGRRGRLGSRVPRPSLHCQPLELGTDQGSGQMSASGKNINSSPSPHRFCYFRRSHICSFEPHNDLMTPGDRMYVLERAQ